MKGKAELDKVFSKYIRKRDQGICFTCGNQKEWKYQQNGHFISRNYLSLRFDEMNCHCQCLACNIYKNGNQVEYARRMYMKYGNKKMEKLHEKKKQKVKFTFLDYFNMIELYKEKLEDL